MNSRARAALDRVGLGWAAAVTRAISRAASASGSRVAAVAVAEPDLLVLDEPTRGLDPERKLGLAALAGGVRRVAARPSCSRRTTATSRRTAGSDLVLTGTQALDGAPVAV